MAKNTYYVEWVDESVLEERVDCAIVIASDIAKAIEKVTEIEMACTFKTITVAGLITEHLVLRSSERTTNVS